MNNTDLLTAITRSIAAADGVELEEVEPLYEYIDPDALSKLAEQEQGEWSLTFQFSDHQVTVTHESQVLVDGVAYSSLPSTR